MYQYAFPRVDVTAPALKNVTEFAFSNIFCRDCLLTNTNSILMTSHEQTHRLCQGLGQEVQKGQEYGSQ